MSNRLKLLSQKQDQTKYPLSGHATSHQQARENSEKFLKQFAQKQSTLKTNIKELQEIKAQALQKRLPKMKAQEELKCSQDYYSYLKRKSQNHIFTIQKAISQAQKKANKKEFNIKKKGEKNILPPIKKKQFQQYLPQKIKKQYFKDSDHQQIDQISRLLQEKQDLEAIIDFADKQLSIYTQKLRKIRQTILMYSRSITTAGNQIDKMILQLQNLQEEKIQLKLQGD